MITLESGCIVIAKVPNQRPHVAGHIYIDVDGERQAVHIEAFARIGSVPLTAGSEVELLLGAVVEQLRDAMKRGKYAPAPRPIEV